MKIINFLFSTIILCFALGGCVPSEEAKPETVPWVNEWLDSSACKPPCWEGITPGVTTLYQISKETIRSNNDLSFEGPTPCIRWIVFILIGNKPRTELLIHKLNACD